MKIEGRTIPSIQNIKKREAFLLEYRDKLPQGYLHDELLRIAKIRMEKKLRWEVKDTRLATQEERMKETAKTFEVVKPKETFISKVKGMFKAQRGN